MTFSHHGSVRATTEVFGGVAGVRVGDHLSPSPAGPSAEVLDVEALEARPDQALMIEIAELWRPWRAVAARMLWSYYALGRKSADAPA